MPFSTGAPSMMNGAHIDQRLHLGDELGAHDRVGGFIGEGLHEGRQIHLERRGAHHPLAEPVHPHLSLVPGDEDRIDGHEAQPMSHAEGGEQVGLAEADDRDVDGAADFEQPRLLEVADHKSIVAGLFRLQRMADDLRGATELGQGMERVGGRIEAVNLEADARIRDTVEQRLEPLYIRSLLDRMNEALVPDPSLTLRHCPASYAFSLNTRTALVS
jgi:hypothetical protein